MKPVSVIAWAQILASWLSGHRSSSVPGESVLFYEIFCLQGLTVSENDFWY